MGFKSQEMMKDYYGFEESENVIQSKIIQSLFVQWGSELQCTINQTTKGNWIDVFLQKVDPSPNMVLATTRNFLPVCSNVKKGLRNPIQYSCLLCSPNLKKNHEQICMFPCKVRKVVKCPMKKSFKMYHGTIIGLTLKGGYGRIQQ